jgi:CPA1 family monovalent cation:H+ antiporter
MATAHIILLFSGLVLLAILLQPLARYLHLPFCATLVIAGFAASELLVGAGVDTGIRAENFHTLVFHVFLPILIFESAYNIDARLLLSHLVPVLLLAIPLMLLSTLVTAVLVYYGIGHPQGFPWIAALLTGALLSATDPVAVVAALRQLGVPERLVLLLEGESLFNDATAIVVFSTLLAFATQTTAPMTIPEASLFFLRVFFGGMLTGAVIGGAFLLVMRLADSAAARSAASVICAYLAFTVAESLLHVSGVMAVLVAALLLGHAARRSARSDDGPVRHLWQFNAWVANALVFLLMGVTVTTDMFTERWLAILIGIAAVIIARAIGLFGVFPLLSAARLADALPYASRSVLFWGGLRGAVTLALALSLPTSLDYWWTIQSIAFGVVLFTLLVQATTMASLIHRRGLDKN